MLRREVNPCGEAVAKASLNRAMQWRDLDPKRSDLPMARLKRGKSAWRTEPTSVENGGDELWVGVKGQSNSVIAGSPRNAFRCSVACFLPEVELLDG